jgi:glucans biosynthesis protein C
MNTSNRLYFLDNIRSLVILLVIVLHGSMSYMAYAPVWWYVVNPQTSLFFTILVLLIDVPIMQIMFFISGYFAMPSLQKRSSKNFLKDKSFHIGLPWVVGVILLAPPTAYLIYYSRRVQMSLLQFWQTDFWGKMYQQSVYWYLGILTLCFVALALVYAASSRLRASKPVTERPSWKVLLVFLVLVTASFFVINLFFYIDDWNTSLYLFVFQPLRLPLYIGYFMLGIYAQQHNWLSDEGYLPRLEVWMPLLLLSGLSYLGMRLSPAAASANPPLLVKAVIDILFNVFCFSSLMTALVAFKKKVNSSSPVWQSLSGSSYGMYFFHPLFLYPLAYLFVFVALPVGLKAICVILLGIMLSWGFSSQVVKKLPVLREIF